MESRKATNVLLLLLLIGVLVFGILFLKQENRVPAVSNAWPETVPATPTNNYPNQNMNSSNPNPNSGYDTQDYRQGPLTEMEISENGFVQLYYAVEGARTQPANFNGHYSVILVSCGSACGTPFLYDKTADKAYKFPEPMFKNAYMSPMQDVPDMTYSLSGNTISIKKQDASGMLYDNQWQLIGNIFMEIQ